MVQPRVDREDVLKTEELLVNIGPQHPSTHGVLRVVVRTDGEIVRESKPFIGYLHRCFEKIAESLPYPQTIPYCDRMDYVASMNDGLAMCMTIEKLLGAEVPERAVWVRMIACELNRIASHLVAVGTYGLDIGAFTPFFYAFREREKVLDILEKISGGRLLYHYIRVGGQLRDLNAEIIDDIKKFIAQMEYRWPEYNQLLSDNLIFVKRTANVGVIPADLAIEYGLTGPCLRGSGVKFDLRRDEPYCFY
ncbi:MAG: NADH-quinone oxidoreductase subunit D, partial [bacterium]